jgi:tRNA pseudouridine55 synthase
VTGFVLVDKPRGPTSFDIVAKVRRAFGVKRVGHAGTLDPGATGLLVIAVGPATRLLRYVQGLTKVYDVTGVLGVRTTSLDADGEIVSRETVDVTPDDVRRAAATFVGQIEQTPPAVSAIKVDGERAYKRAARGEDVEMTPRNVTIEAFDILRVSSDAFDARVTCSTGTYIRTLVADVGEVLGCGAHVAHLRRTAIGDLTVREATRLEKLDEVKLRSVEDTLSHLPRVDIDAEAEALARNGRRIELQAPVGDVLVVGPSGAVGVFESRDGILRPSTVIGTVS